MAIKENSADKLQRETLERQKELAPKSRVCDIFTSVLFCLFICGFALIHIIMPDREKSDSENRMLQQLPEFSSESLFSGEYTAEMTKYLSDQFPFRDFFINVKATSENTLFRMENGGIMFGDNTLTARIDNPNTDNLKVNLDAVTKFTSALEKEGIHTIFSPAGRRVDVCLKDLPAGYGRHTQDKLWNEINSAGKSLDCSYIDLRGHLLDLSESGKNVYFRTDHHWNIDGAYSAYTEIWKNLPSEMTDGRSARPEDFFKRETVTDEFYGTSYSASGASWITPDIIELMRFEGDDTIPVTVADNGETSKGLYKFDFLQERDKYSVFLGENCGRLNIGNGDRKTLVIIKDSFAQSITPFFAADFDVVLIDPRYFKGSVFRTIQEISPDSVLILMNADTLTTSTTLRALMRGVK